MKKSCYMCESDATSKEHVPPKCLFPEKKDLPKGFDFRKNLIKVPSCDKHNSRKSNDDEYLMFVLASAFQGNEHKKNHFESKVMRTFQRRPHILSSFLKNLTPVYLQDRNGEVEESASFQVDLKRFESSVFHMACGIYYYHFKSKWSGDFKVFTNILMDLKSKNAPDVNDLMAKICEKTSGFFSGEIAVGENQEIFKYKLISDVSNRCLVHMVFYEKVEISVLLKNV